MTTKRKHCCPEVVGGCTSEPCRHVDGCQGSDGDWDIWCDCPWRNTWKGRVCRAIRAVLPSLYPPRQQRKTVLDKELW